MTRNDKKRSTLKRKQPNHTNAQNQPRPAASAAKDKQRELPLALQRRVDRISELCSKHRSRDSLGAYKISVEVLGVLTGGPKYGDRAIQILAKRTGYDTKTLYRWAAVARTWPRAKVFAKLASRHAPNGFGLTWSHLQDLAAIKAAARRSRLIETTFKELLTVRELRERIEVTKGRVAESKMHPVNRPATPTSVSETVHELAGKVRAVRSSIEHISKSKLGDAETSALEEYRDECQATLKVLARILAPAPAAAESQPAEAVTTRAVA